MISRKFLFAAVPLLALAACQSADKAAVATQSAVQAQTTPSLSTTDATFLNTASVAGNEEVQFGQLAEKKANLRSTRSFAARMVTDHTAAGQQLATLAQSKQITPDTAMDPDHTTQFASLQKLHGRAFDRAYLNGQLQDHMAAVQLFQNEAQNGTDPQVRAFAQQTLPTLQAHLKMVQGLSGQRATHR